MTCLLKIIGNLSGEEHYQKFIQLEEVDYEFAKEIYNFVLSHKDVETTISGVDVHPRVTSLNVEIIEDKFTINELKTLFGFVNYFSTIKYDFINVLNNEKIYFQYKEKLKSLRDDYNYETIIQDLIEELDDIKANTYYNDYLEDKIDRIKNFISLTFLMNILYLKS